MKKLLIILMLLAGTYSMAAAQVGAKVSLFSPRGDLSPTFKKGMAYEAFLCFDTYEGSLRSRVGIIHADMAPRLDTFPVYGVKGDKTVLPGFEVYDYYKLNALYIDQDFRLFRIKNFSFYAGIGLMYGIAKIKYTRSIETLIIESGGALQQKVGGVRMNLQASYAIGKHFFIMAEAMHNAIVVTDWSSSHSHRMYGLGFCYRFIDFE